MELKDALQLLLDKAEVECDSHANKVRELESHIVTKERALDTLEREVQSLREAKRALAERLEASQKQNELLRSGSVEAGALILSSASSTCTCCWWPSIAPQRPGTRS